MSSRPNRSAASLRQNALTRLSEMKKTGKRQLDAVQIDDDLVYDEVPEEEYHRIVSRRRCQKSFVVGGGLGYADDGEEDWDTGDPGDNEKEILLERKNQQKSFNELKRRPKKAKPAPPPKSISAAFLKLGRPQKQRPIDGSDLGEIENLLAQLQENPTGTLQASEENEEQTLEPAKCMEDIALFGRSKELRETHDAVMSFNLESARSKSGQNISTRDSRLPDDSSNDALARHSKGSIAIGLTSDTPASLATDSCAPAHSGNLPETHVMTSPSREAASHSVQSSNGQIDSAHPCVEPLPSAPPTSKLATATIAATEGEEWSKLSARTSHPVSSSAGATVSTGGLHLLDEEGILTLFWLDAFHDPRVAPGRVYLVGKALVPGTSDQTVSCSVVVSNMQRNVFVLPRPHFVSDPSRPEGTVSDQIVSMGDVYKEIDELAASIGIQKWKSKPVTRSYSFENDGSIPAESEYLKIVYSADQPPFPKDATGRTFSKIFGTGSSSLELFLLKRHLVGPCWLQVKACRQHSPPHTWCKAEFVIDSHKYISKIADQPSAPLLTVLSLRTQCVFNPKIHSNEILSFSCLIHKSVSMDGPTANVDSIEHFSAVRSPDTRALPFDLSATLKARNLPITCHANERALLSFLISRIREIDADVIVGHNLYGFGLEILLRRLGVHHIRQWSVLGRLRRNRMPKIRSGDPFASALAAVSGGRLFCDTQSSAKELTRATTYTLSHLASVHLKKPRTELDSSNVVAAFTTTKGVLQVVHHCENDAFLTLQLMFHLMILPLTKQLTCLCGNLWSRSLQSARAERVEYLLLHEFHRIKGIVPEKFTYRERKELATLGSDDTQPTGRRKPQYAGGLVLEPRKGFYDKFVLLLDFNSLYPSIIQEYNICFTTINHWVLDEDGLPALPQLSDNSGVLPRLIRTLIDRRRSVKSLLKSEQDPIRKKQYDVRQQALKLVANSMYGCLGFSHSRFYCKPLAALITSQGRQILSATVSIAQKLGYDVIYGDTDSIMINTGVTDLGRVREIGAVIKKEVNKKYQTLEIEIDGIFSSMLLLQKKKYAANVISERNGKVFYERELKGIDMVRRDWCPLSKLVGESVVGEILSGKCRDEVVDNIHEILRRTGENVRNGRVPLEQFIISKSLTKDPREYPNGKAHPHVNVAQKMSAMGLSVCIGDQIPYVILEGSESSVALRADMPSAATKESGKGSIDLEWYLSQQVLPPITRLCGPIEGTDVQQLANCLGLDGSKFNVTQGAEDAAEEFIEAALCLRNLDDEEGFKDAEKLLVKCSFCHNEFEFAGVLNFKTNRCGLLCPHPKCPGLCGQNSEVVSPLFLLKNCIRRAAIRHITRYNNLWSVCSDAACRFRSRQGHPSETSKCVICSQPCSLEYSEAQLFLQLRYFMSLFDVERAARRVASENKLRHNRNQQEIMLTLDLSEVQKRSFAEMEAFVKRELLLSSAYFYIDADSVFGLFNTLKISADSHSTQAVLAGR